MNRWERAIRAIVWTSRVLERSAGDLSLPQYRVLSLVASAPERASQLAQRVHVARPTLTAVIDGLVDRGLIRRCDVTGDRRGVMLRATPRGIAALRRAEAAMVEALRSVLDDPGPVLDGLEALHAQLHARASAEAR